METIAADEICMIFLRILANIPAAEHIKASFYLGD
jgi:hypothetical protein